jgi:putative membrane protein insertion efficiency factor
MNAAMIRARARKLVWLAGVPARALLLGLIRLYRMTLSGALGGQCRFYPSCSHYAEEAILARGFVRGWVLATWRILRCNPFGKGGLEPAPEPLHDDVIHRQRERAA